MAGALAAALGEPPFVYVAEAAAELLGGKAGADSARAAVGRDTSG